MWVKTQTLVASLRSIKLDKMSDVEVEDVIVGCIDVLECSPTTRFEAWMAMKPERSVLDDPAKAAKTKKGRRQVQDLIDLTISDLSASVAFRPEVQAGVLPIRLPKQRTLTEAQRAGQAKGRATQAANRRRRRDQLAARLCLTTA